MRAQHTPGPIHTDEAEHDQPYQHIKLVGSKGMTIATVWIDDAPTPDYNAEQAANARRLAACWNACEGLTTEALEDGCAFEPISVCCGLPEKCERMCVPRASHFKAQRDELLEALEVLTAGIENSVSSTYIPLVKARAAIAKATGQEGGAA